MGVETRAVKAKGGGGGKREEVQKGVGSQKEGRQKGQGLRGQRKRRVLAERWYYLTAPGKALTVVELGQANGHQRFAVVHQQVIWHTPSQNAPCTQTCKQLRLITLQYMLTMGMCMGSNFSLPDKLEWGYESPAFLPCCKIPGQTLSIIVIFGTLKVVHGSCKLSLHPASARRFGLLLL